MSPTIGSLCSGVGGLELGLETATGGRTIWQAEIDADGAQVLARHWPGVTNLGDLRAVEWGTVERPDILCAGYPCQPFSQAGERRGEQDPRHLWPAVADAVRALRPAGVVLENVRGHLTLGFGAVLGDLAAAGYDARWEVLRASDVGAPHRRERVFAFAWDTAGDTDGVAGSAPGERSGRCEEIRQSPAIERVERPGGLDSAPDTANRWGRTAPELGEDRADRGRAEPGGGAGTASDTAGGIGEGASALPAATRGAAEPGERTGGDAGHPADVEWGRYGPAIRRWELLHGPAPVPALGRHLNPAFVEWMMGFSPGWVTGTVERITAQLRLLGNAVVPQVAARAWALLTDETRW